MAMLAKVTELHDGEDWHRILDAVRSQRLDPWSAIDELLG